MNFFTLDIETANANSSSICQVGIAKFEEKELIKTWDFKINPEDYFDPFNSSLHGILENDVKISPKFYEIYSEIEGIIGKNVVIHHMPFDKVAIRKAYDKYDLPHFDFDWLDQLEL